MLVYLSYADNITNMLVYLLYTAIKPVGSKGFAKQA